MIRTRFAPSPTGYLHIGGLRTALYAYLFAKQNKGKFILRIEDTDQTRQIEKGAEHLINILNFFDLKPDEGPENGGKFGPYIQSERKQIHQGFGRLLLEKGAGYRCFCTQERLTAMRKDQTKQKLPSMYDKHCRYLSEEVINDNLKLGIPHVIRQKIPSNENIVVPDLIRGNVSFNSNTIDDQVLLKSDGFPTYHLANVVDDHLMEITHVIRAEEWLPSTPKHLLLYRAFGWKEPEFAHLPLLLNPDKSKLSKRQGDVAAENYLQKGYLKEAIINFVCLLGWNPGKGDEQEVFSINELIEKFSLAHVQKAGAIVNIEKLNWLNGIYIKKMPLNELTSAIIPYLEKEAWFQWSVYSSLTEDHIQYLESCVALEQQRLRILSEAPELLKFFLVDEIFCNKDIVINEKMRVDENIAKIALQEGLKALTDLSSNEWKSIEAIKGALLGVIQKLGFKNGQILWPIRVSVTGEKFSPGAFEVVHVLGKEKTLDRIEKALKMLSSSTS